MLRTSFLSHWRAVYNAAPGAIKGKRTVTAPLKLLCVLAHADDESLGVSGILTKYAVESIETYLITAT